LPSDPTSYPTVAEWFAAWSMSLSTIPKSTSSSTRSSPIPESTFAKFLPQSPMKTISTIESSSLSPTCASLSPISAADESLSGLRGQWVAMTEDDDDFEIPLPATCEDTTGVSWYSPEVWRLCHGEADESSRPGKHTFNQNSHDSRASNWMDILDELESVEMANADEEFPDLGDSESEGEEPELANGSKSGEAPPPADEPGSGETCKAVRSRRDRWRSKKTQSRLDLGTGEVVRCAREKTFEEFTVRELREIVEDVPFSGDLGNFGADVSLHLDGPPPGLSSVPTLAADAVCGNLNIFEKDDDGEKSAGEILNLSWRSDPEDFDNRKWVKIKSVVDSGASAPVAPPQMMPSVRIEPSEGSRRGQRYSSASKHKLKNLGQQRLMAMTEDGEPTEVLFQIADVSKPLMSVSSICEKGNRVIFGKAGGVVQNIRTGRLIPFQRENGIYVLSL
jgi:hypothetical protein